jgi:hypothetical protein
MKISSRTDGSPQLCAARLTPAVAAAFLQPVHQQDQGLRLEVALVPGA